MQGQLAEVNGTFGWLLQSFFMGLRFDALVTAYLLAPLLVFLLISDFMRFSHKWSLRISLVYSLIVFLPAFFICAADIPFYKQFGERFCSTAFEWNESKGFVLRLIFSNFSYWGYLFLFIILYAVYFLIIRSVTLRCIGSSKDLAINNASKSSALYKTGAYILMAGVFVLCMRGRISLKSPMQEGTAFISEYMLINELGLNPVYTFYQSLDDAKYARVHFMDDATAVKNAQNYLGITNPETKYPLARRFVCDGEPERTNVVVVIMESMCTFKMGDYNGPDLTPQLDSLIHKSLYFSNFYSSGIHTFNGIYSTLYGFPGILQWQPLKDLEHVKYAGLADALKRDGYSSVYFTTHDDQFDNVGGFLRYNGFDKIVSQHNYPASKVISVLGVPDHFMFDFSLPVLDTLYAKGSPFLSVYMTASDHGPWIIPSNIPFTPSASNEQDRATQYADWAIDHFLKEASKHPWFKNTLFVFLGDHGLSMGHTYDLSLSYHHIPCIFYSPSLIPEPEKVDCLGGQIDVFPTIMDLLNMSFVNNTMGVDLLKVRRPYMFFSDDDKVGCIGPKYYFIHRMTSKESLYEYGHLSKTELIDEYPLVADSMRNYVYSMLQATKWVITNDEFGNVIK
jgi:phosphoglycerol transferase MdoB-like AlkP superfamily enzyme